MNAWLQNVWTFHLSMNNHDNLRRIHNAFCLKIAKDIFKKTNNVAMMFNKKHYATTIHQTSNISKHMH